MKKIEDLLSEVKKESDLKVSEITEKAKFEAEKILSKARVEAERVIDIAKVEAEKNFEEVIKRAKLRADAEEKNLVLKEKQRLIKKAVAEAKEAAGNGGEYLEILKELLKNSDKSTGGKIIFREEDYKAFSAKGEISDILKEKNLEISNERLAEFERGFIISYGDMEENCTFDAIFREKKDEFSDVVGKILFG